jgi:ribose transport system permease protein
MFMAIGIEKALHQQTTIINSKEIKAFSTVEFGLPIVVWLMILLFIASFLVVNKTKFGFELRIVGENKLAGIEAGINIQVMKIIAYIIAGSLLGLAATIESTRVGAIYLQGQNYMLPIFAACYLGSSMFIPGRVNILGTFVGALFMGIIGSFMKMMNVESYIIPIVQGTILIIAVGVASFRTRDKIQQVKV